MGTQSVMTEFGNISTEKDRVEKEIDKSTIAVGKFNTPFQWVQQIDKTSVRV